MSPTKILKIDPLNPQEEYIKLAAATLAKGGLVILPTETVYGIAANLQNKRAIASLYQIKQRPSYKPFSLHLDRKERVMDFAKDITLVGWKLMHKFWPGPLTLIFKAKDNGTIGIRIPDNEIALRIISRAQVPIVCPSANLSGKPAPVSFPEAVEDLFGLVDIAIDAGETSLGLESTVIDLTGNSLNILREGALKKENIEAELKKKTVLFVCTGNSCRSVMAEALLKKRLKEKNRQDVEVLSAGIMMLSGRGATAQTQEVLGQEGIDVSRHLSQGVTSEIVRRSDFILVMEKIHEEKISQLVPEAKNRVFLLKEFAKIRGNSLDIHDPIGTSLEFYKATLKVIKEAVDVVVELI